MGKILIVGKPSRERDGLALVLEFAGNRCTMASSVEEAGELVKKETYDLLLGDSSLEGNGPEQMVRMLRSLAPGMKCLVLTEEADPRLGSDEAVTLPYSPVERLSTNFAAIRKEEALMLLLPKPEGLGHLSDIPQTPAMLNRLAALYHSQEMYEAAERFYKQALKIAEKVSRNQSPEVASILNNLATLYHDQERYAEAEMLYKKSLAIVEKIFGPKHTKVARRLRSLADLYHAQDRDERAAPLYERLKTMK
ncbi:MAG: tetratricopeptide repeat protein [Acidobacteria bacterium]|nr:tetratricopeptide repeat protein [Acidobacteriota bacterium]